MAYIQGPCLVKRDGAVYYFEDGLTVKVARRTNVAKSDIHGEINKFTLSTLVTISGKPAPLVANFANFFSLGSADIGTSIFGGSDVPLEIWSKTEAKKYTWARTGVMKAPQLVLSASQDIFNGEMQWAALKPAGVLATNATAWKAEAAQAFSDTGFDPTKNRRYRYVATYGDDSDFAAITAQKGFAIDIGYETSEIPDDNVGVADIDLVSITAGVKFIPSNLSEAKIHKLIRLQDSDALQPGDIIGGTSGQNLLISGTDGVTGFDATLFGAGFTDSDLVYKTATLRAGEVAGMVSRTFTAGEADPIFEFTITEAE